MPNGIGVSFGRADGSFSPLVLYPAGNDVGLGEVGLGDYNGDGILDAVTVGPSGIWLFPGKGNGVFGAGVLTPTQGLLGGSVVVADFNHDGRLDLAVAYRDSQTIGFAIAFGNGDGTFKPLVVYNSSSGPGYLQAYDFNGDGYPDLAFGGSTTSLSIYLNDRQGGFMPTAVTGFGSISVERFAIGDLNHDGLPDLVNTAGCVLFGKGLLVWSPPFCYPVNVSQGYRNVVLSSLRGDGLIDIVEGEINVVSVLLNHGGGGFEDGLWMSVPGSGNCAASGDLNNDGKVDLVVPTSQGLSVFFGTGNIRSPFRPGATLAVQGVGCPILGDVNGDGLIDIVVGANASQGVDVYLNSGNGMFAFKSTTAMNPGVLVLGDFNHDGKLDIADSSNQLAYGNGDGTFRAPINISPTPPASGYSWIASGDFNGDAFTDLVLTSYRENSLYLLINNQHGAFTQSTIVNSDGPNGLALADLNHDGNLDVVVTMSSLNVAEVYLGNGQGGLIPVRQKVPYGVFGAFPATVGDVNGDGVPDLLLPTGESVGIALGTGIGTFGVPFYVGTGPASGQVLLENLKGQAPSLGLPDIVAPDLTGGVMLLLNTTK